MNWITSDFFCARVLESCLCISSWNVTLRRRCTGPTLRCIALVCLNAVTTAASTCTPTHGLLLSADAAALRCPATSPFSSTRPRCLRLKAGPPIRPLPRAPPPGRAITSHLLLPPLLLPILTPSTPPILVATPLSPSQWPHPHPLSRPLATTHICVWAPLRVRVPPYAIPKQKYVHNIS